VFKNEQEARGRPDPERKTRNKSESEICLFGHESLCTPLARRAAPGERGPRGAASQCAARPQLSRTALHSPMHVFLHSNRKGRLSLSLSNWRQSRGGKGEVLRRAPRGARAPARAAAARAGEARRHPHPATPPHPPHPTPLPCHLGENDMAPQLMMPLARPTSMKASTAQSTSASVCAAEICVRMRARPLGTTGKEKLPGAGGGEGEGVGVRGR
jgi:hypothetical protein